MAHGIAGTAAIQDRRHRARQQIARMAWAMMTRENVTRNLSHTRGMEEIASGASGVM
jgi:hypothetical protein